MYDLPDFGLDMLDKDAGPENRKPLLEATMRLFEEDRERETEYQLALGVADGHVLGYPFFPNAKFNSVIFDHPQVTKFGYWNNTDPDEDASEEEWEERERLWDKVFENESVPNRAMLIVVLADKHHLIPTDQHMEDLPSVESREKAVANQLAWGEVTKEVYDPKAGNL